MRYGKNVKHQNSLFPRDLRIPYLPFFHRRYFFCLLMRNVIKNKNFELPKKLYEIREKLCKLNCLCQVDVQIYFRALFNQTRCFRFNCKKRH